MNDHDDESFGKMNLKVKIITITVVIGLVVTVFGFFISLFFFGFAGLFSILGVEYTSAWSLLIFVVSFFILGFFVEIIIGGLTKFAIQQVNTTSSALVIELIFNFAGNWFVLNVVNFFIKSVTLTSGATIIIAFFLSLVDVVFDNKFKNKA